MRHRKRMQEMFGTDADLLNYCLRRGKVTPLLDVLTEFLDVLKVQPDPAYPDHRDHLSDAEKVLLERFFQWCFGYKTHEEPLPPLSYWRAKLHKSVTHMRHMIRFLAGQGLLRIFNACKPGLALHFSIDVLLDRVREWLGIAPKPQPVPEEEPAPVPALEGEKQPIPFPVPEPEPVPVPEAAMVAAPEWQTIKEQALARTPKGAHHWFNSVQAYRDDKTFIIVAQLHPQARQLSTRFHDLLMSLIEKYCAWCQFVRYDVAARSAG